MITLSLISQTLSPSPISTRLAVIADAESRAALKLLSNKGIKTCTKQSKQDLKFTEVPDFNSYKHSIECFCRKSSCIHVLLPKLAINSPATWQSGEQPTKTTALCERDCWAKPPSPGGETAITVKPSIRGNHPF